MVYRAFHVKYLQFGYARFANGRTDSLNRRLNAIQQLRQIAGSMLELFLLCQHITG